MQAKLFCKKLLLMLLFTWGSSFLVLGSSYSAAQDEPAEEKQAATRAEQDPQVAARVQETIRQDRTTEQLLAARFARVEALSDIEVEVTAGVVTLRGLVADEHQRELASQLAQNLEEVVAVNNRLQIDTALDQRLAPVLSDGLDRMRRLIMALPLLLVAGLVIVLAYVIGRWLTRFERPFHRLRNPFLADLLRHAMRLLLLAGGILVALNLLGATALVSAVLGAAGIAGLALGFAFRDLVENYIAGILLSLRQPFAPDDHVMIEEHEGRVATLTSRATSLITLDGNHLRLPNATVFKGVILNYTRNPTRMFTFEVELLKGADVAQAQQVARSATEKTQGVLAAPAPAAMVQEIKPTGVLLACNGWVDQREYNFYKVRSAAMRRVNAALEEACLMPDLINKVAMVDQNATPPRQPASAPSGEACPAEDVSPEDSIDEQLQTERRVSARHNLLRHDAPRE